MADIAHPAGLIAKGLLSSPFDHCHFVTSTTHKTLRGPRGGVIMMGKDFENPFGLKDLKGNIRMMSNLLDMAVFPGTQGGKKAQETLDKAHITLNKNAVPYDDKSPFVTSGIRVGVPAITTRGLKEEHMQTVVDLIDKVLMNIDDAGIVSNVSKEVNEFMCAFPLYPEING